MPCHDSRFLSLLSTRPRCLRTLGLGVAVASLSPAAWGQLHTPVQADSAVLTTPAGQGVQDYELPAAPLGSALATLAAQSGLLLSFDPALTEGRQAAALRGRHTPADALQRLLAGTGLQALPQADGSWLLQRARAEGATSIAGRPAQLSEVRVVGRNPGASDLFEPYAGGQVARGSQLGFLGNQDFLDSPFSTQAYTREYLEARQPQRLSDVIGLADPSVEFDSVNGYAEQIQIRGFPSYAQDITYGGLYGVLPSMRIYPELAERIEVLRGPSVLLNGMMPDGSVGGVVNVVPKRAEADPVMRLSTTYSSRQHLGIGADVGRRFGPDQALGVRFNGFYRQGEAEVRQQDRHTGLGTLGLDWRGNGVRLSADLIANREKGRGFGYWSFAGDIADTGVPAAPDPRRFMNSPGSYYENQDNAAVLRAEVDIGRHWLAYLAVGGRSSHFTSLANHIDILNLAGDTTDSWYFWRTRSQTYSGVAGVRGRVQTGPVRHDINLNVTAYREKNRNDETTIEHTPWESNIHRLDYGPSPGVMQGELVPSSRQRLRSIGVADTLHLVDDAVKLTLGLRKQWIRSDDHAWDEHYDESALSPTVAAVWAINPALSVYANHAQGLSQGQVAPAGAANAGQSMPPYKSKQYEAGLKYDHESWSTVFSVFQIRQPSAALDEATNIFAVDGDTRNRGVEWTVMGKPWRNTRLLGGVAFNDATYEGVSAGADAGNQVAGVPRTLVKLGAEHDLTGVPGLSVNGAIQRSSRQPFKRSNTAWAPAWTRVDVGMRYQTRVGGRPLTLRADMQNLTNKGYWLAPAFNGLGAPRTLLLSATVDF